MSEGFFMDTWTAMLFFRICRRYSVETRDDRIVLMRELTRRKKAKYVRDVEDFTKDQRVLRITHKRGVNEN